jgi:hypothetical protein
MGSAVLVGVLCTAVLFGLSLARGTAPMAGVAHSERGPSSASMGTPTAAATSSVSVVPEPSDVAPAPRRSTRGPAVAPAPVPVAPVIAPPVEQVVAPPTTEAPAEVVVGVVHQGSFCKRTAVGQTGYTSDGTAMTCEYDDGEEQPRWRAAGGEPTEPTDTDPETADPTTTKPPPATEPSESRVHTDGV